MFEAQWQRVPVNAKFENGHKKLTLKVGIQLWDKPFMNSSMLALQKNSS